MEPFPPDAYSASSEQHISGIMEVVTLKNMGELDSRTGAGTCFVVTVSFAAFPCGSVMITGISKS